MQELLVKELQEEQLLRDITGVQVMARCPALLSTFETVFAHEFIVLDVSAEA